jgi:hypothetical protein
VLPCKCARMIFEDQLDCRVGCIGGVENRGNTGVNGGGNFGTVGCFRHFPLLSGLCGNPLCWSAGRLPTSPPMWNLQAGARGRSRHRRRRRAPIHPADEGGTTTPSRTPGISSSFRRLARSAAKVGRSLVFMFHLSIATVWRNRRLAAERSVTQKSSRGTHVMQYYDDKMSTSYCIYFSQNLITSDRLLA